MDKFISLKNQISGCKRCELYKTCKQPVVARGDLSSSVMFIGEAPGAEEDRLALPFVGRSGKLLDKAIVEGGLDIERVYITNIVKCRPPGNRNPKANEISACLAHLEKQIRYIRPKLLVTLGAFSSTCLLSQPHCQKTISQVRGKTYGSDKYRCIIFPVFHPAATLYDVSKREVFIKDINNIKKILDS